MSRQNLRESVENPREGFLWVFRGRSDVTVAKTRVFLDRYLDRISGSVEKTCVFEGFRGFSLVVGLKAIFRLWANDRFAF